MESNNYSVINIKLTDKGRELLSRGKLNFSKFGIGDSEIDYEFNDNVGIDVSENYVFRPLDDNPEITSFITKEVGGENLTDLPDVSNTTTTITNTPESRGMFDISDSTLKKLYVDPKHIKQANCEVIISNVIGNKSLTLNQSSSYIVGSPEPVVGDYILIKWSNQYSITSKVNNIISEPIPYLFYKIISIDSGSLANNSMRVTVDRDLPNYSNVSTSFNSGAFIYPNNNNGNAVDTYYGSTNITDFLSESIFSFLENYDTPTIDVPVWNMTIIFTEDIIGIDPLNDKDLSFNGSVSYGGIVRYLERISPKVKNVGLIHYTNQSPSNNYGEGFAVTPTNTPILDLPTIMWHKNTDGKIGLKLTGDYSSIDKLPSLNTIYMNLIDENSNIVGKVFPSLKLFIIEDQELLFAMSYKSNRNWTLPDFDIALNLSLCVESDLELEIK